MKNQVPDYNDSPIPASSTMIVKICGTIETPPEGNREKFRQGIMDTVLQLVRSGDFIIEYIGYQEDKNGMHYLNKDVTEYHDCVFASLNITHSVFSVVDLDSKTDEIISTFSRIFEDKTHRHLNIDSITVDKWKNLRMIYMSSDWRFYSRHG
ncbi:hypothetical protein [Flavobacterium pallidum]|uniref:Uncharacterized protein n=1 Tax=Flavobacterium pallidum TaxID=2172098 RepID=A0A2S1SKU1_9FLAO|nr:hypothetical protein [Flavobacterium pallidum]AWI26957.1 hypothetical protein HYN49_14180 [Flavobacterium pallidum]